MQAPDVLEIAAPHGLARAHVHDAAVSSGSPRGALVLGHGAGGGVGAPDMVAVTARACDEGFAVALVEQPYRVAGRRAPAPAPQLDANWMAVIEALRSGPFGALPIVVGGRSMGARVACRTANQAQATGVLCLAFPLQPAARAGKPPAPSRLTELDAVSVPVLVVQGERDPFGMPPERPDRVVARVPGDHALKRDIPAVVEAVTAWLNRVLPR